MTKWKRRARAVAVAWLIKFFCNAIKGCIAWEGMMAKQDECTHEGMEGKRFCGDCGKGLVSDTEVELDSALERVLTKHGIIGKKKGGLPEPEKKKSLADRLKEKK